MQNTNVEFRCDNVKIYFRILQSVIAQFAARAIQKYYDAEKAKYRDADDRERDAFESVTRFLPGSAHVAAGLLNPPTPGSGVRGGERERV